MIKRANPYAGLTLINAFGVGIGCRPLLAQRSAFVLVLSGSQYDVEYTLPKISPASVGFRPLPSSHQS